MADSRDIARLSTPRIPCSRNRDQPFFPEFAHTLPQPLSLSPRDIQTAAAAAAAAAGIANWKLSCVNRRFPASRAVESGFASMPIEKGKGIVLVKEQRTDADIPNSDQSNTNSGAQTVQTSDCTYSPAEDFISVTGKEMQSEINHGICSNHQSITTAAEACCEPSERSSRMPDSLTTNSTQKPNSSFGDEILFDYPYAVADMAEAMLLAPPLQLQPGIPEENEVWDFCLWDHDDHSTYLTKQD